MAKVAIIGGTGVYESGILADVKTSRLLTPYGTAVIEEGFLNLPDRDPLEVVFLARHGAGHAIPPHRINYRANIWALHQLGVDRVIGTGAVGSLREDFPPGDCVLADSFLDFTRNRPLTFYEGEPVAPGGPSGVVHTDMTEPYCPQLRGLLASSAAAEGIPLHDGGCYVCTEGPPVSSSTRAMRSSSVVVVMSIVSSAPSALPIARRIDGAPIKITCTAPASCARITALSPTGPLPCTSTVSPRRTPPRSTA